MIGGNFAHHYLADGTSNTSVSDESKFTVMTFSKDREITEWRRGSQSARIVQSYKITEPGHIAVVVLEHPIPGLVGSSTVVDYQLQGQSLKLTAYPQQFKPKPVSSHRKIESIFARCPDV